VARPGGLYEYVYLLISGRYHFIGCINKEHTRLGSWQEDVCLYVRDVYQECVRTHVIITSMFKCSGDKKY